MPRPLCSIDQGDSSPSYIYIKSVLVCKASMLN